MHCRHNSSFLIQKFKSYKACDLLTFIHFLLKILNSKHWWFLTLAWGLLRNSQGWAAGYHSHLNLVNCNQLIVCFIACSIRFFLCNRRDEPWTCPTTECLWDQCHSTYAAQKFLATDVGSLARRYSYCPDGSCRCFPSPSIVQQMWVVRIFL